MNLALLAAFHVVVYETLIVCVHVEEERDRFGGGGRGRSQEGGEEGGSLLSRLQGRYKNRPNNTIKGGIENHTDAFEKRWVDFVLGEKMAKPRQALGEAGAHLDG